MSCSNLTIFIKATEGNYSAIFHGFDCRLFMPCGWKYSTNKQLGNLLAMKIKTRDIYQKQNEYISAVTIVSSYVCL